MSQIESMSYDRAATAARVRQNVLSAAIAAALMLWYGFSVLRFSGGTGSFSLGDAISIHTLRIGGIAMAVSTLASMTGSRWALLFDGVCSVLIGVLFCVSAVLMMNGGGSGFLYIIVGVMFAVSGVRNAREWTALTPTRSIKTRRMPDPRTVSPRDVVTATSLADQMQAQKRQPKAEPPPEGFLSSFAPEQETDSDNT